MITLLLCVAVATLLLFTFVILFGAPYLPTLSPQVEKALDMIDLEEGQTLLELGCGDGKVLVAAAKRGYRVIGYELNPLLAGMCWLRTRKHRSDVRVVWGDFWKKEWPEADGIFVFLLDRYMSKLDNKITQTYRGKNVKLVSFAFEIPGKVAKEKSQGLLLYAYSNQK